MAHELIINTFNGLREYLSVLLANVPVVATMAPANEQRLQEIEASFTQRMDAINQDLLRRIAAMNKTIATMGDALSYNRRLAHARAFNASAREGTSKLEALPLPNGANPPPGQFPPTLDHFRALTGVDLAALINLYALLLPHYR